MDGSRSGLAALFYTELIKGSNPLPSTTGQKHIRYVQHSYKVKVDGFNSLVAHMKKTTTTVKEIFDEEGRLVSKETTTIVEEDTPKIPTTYPYQPSIWTTPIAGGVTYNATITPSSTLNGEYE